MADAPDINRVKTAVRENLRRINPTADPEDIERIIQNTIDRYFGNDESNMETAVKIAETGRHLYSLGFMPGTSGNISVRTGPDRLLITGSGLNKGRMTPDDMALMDVRGNVISRGKSKPSSEWKMHTACYMNRPDINAVIHTHSPYCTAFAVTGRQLGEPQLPEAVVILGNIPTIPYSTPSTEEVPDNLKPYLKNHNAFLLTSHGALILGKDLKSAEHMMETLEFYAQVVFLARQMGGERYLGREEKQKIADLFRS